MSRFMQIRCRHPLIYGIAGVSLVTLGAVSVYYLHGEDRGLKERTAAQAILDAKEPPPRRAPDLAGRDEPLIFDEPITPEEAGRLMADARSIPNVMRRTAECIRIIERVCRAGKADTAWALIDGNPGQVRNSELSKFFKFAGLDTKQLIEKLSGLHRKGFGSEAGIALQGYFSGISATETAALLADPRFQAFAKELEAASPRIIPNELATALMQRVGFSPHAEQEEAMERAVEYRASGFLNDDEFAAVLQADDRKNSFEKWDLIADYPTARTFRNQAHALRDEIIAGMVTADAPKAMSEFTKERGDRGILDIGTGIHQWGMMDAVAANAWFNTNRAHLNADQRDGVAFAFARLALTNQEPDGAEQWIDQIAKPDRQNKARQWLAASVKKE